MKSSKITDELWNRLTPFIKEHKEKKDSVSKENVEDLIDFAEDAEVEKELLAYIDEHPDAVFWDLLDVIPPGLGKGVTLADLQDD